MSLDPQLQELMNQVLVIEAAGDTDKYNNPVYGTPVSVDCYLVRMNKIAMSRGGLEVTSTLQAFLANPSLVVTEDDLITISDGSHPAIIEILSAPDEDGNDYYLEVRA